MTSIVLVKTYFYSAGASTAAVPAADRSADPIDALADHRLTTDQHLLAWRSVYSK